MDDPIDIEDEMVSLYFGLTFPAFRGLVAMGADAGFAARLCEVCALGLGRVTERDGLWEPDEGGAPRLMLAVTADHGGLIDIVALSSLDRDAWTLRTGDGVILGLPALAEAEDAVGRNQALDRRKAQVALRVFARPLDWLAAGGAGVCVLDWGAAAVTHLRLLGPRVTLLTDDARSAEALARALRDDALPKVQPAGDRGRMAA